MKKTILIVFTVITVMLTSTGCKNDELTRDTAEKLIKEKLQLPGNEIETFTTCSIITNGSDFEELQQAGLLTYNTLDNCTFLKKVYHAYLTDAGKKYAVGNEYADPNDDCWKGINVIVAKQDFGEIKGILQTKGSNTAVVTYTLVRKDITPFGSITFKLTESTIDKEKDINFTKYDDGWRIDK